MQVDRRLTYEANSFRLRTKYMTSIISQSYTTYGHPGASVGNLETF